MATTTNRLSAKRVEAETNPGLYPDGDGLYLQVTGADAKSWLFRYTIRGKQRWMGLGSARSENGGLSLAEARRTRDEKRADVRRGVDPVQERKDEAKARRLEQARSIDFESAAFQYIAAHRPSWDNPKHASQWDNTLRTYAYPKIGKLNVGEIDTQLVLDVLRPIWSEKPETASRVRGRIERVLDWSTSAGYRVGANPARWRGHLENLLPARAKVAKVEHHAALPYLDIGSFMIDLRAREGIAALALEFLVLTAARTAEVIGARWSEMDLDEKLWTVPAGRMKGKREHRVPLSDAAVAVLRKVHAHSRQHDHVFPNLTNGRALSNMAMLKQLERMGRADLTVHGFRSTFSDWANERTGADRNVIEMALAHAIGDKVEAAYRRGDLFEKRRKLMDAWATFCANPFKAGQVVDFGERASA